MRKGLFILGVILYSITAICQSYNRAEAGAQFTYFHQHGFTRENALFGLRASYDLIPLLALEAQVDTSITHRFPGGSSFDGGQLTIGNFGFRVRLPKLKRVEPFALARAGFVSNGAAITAINFSDIDPANAFIHKTRLTEPSINFGGGVNVMLSRRVGIRIDVTDTETFYRFRRVVVHFDKKFNGIVTNSAEASTGVFFRF